MKPDRLPDVLAEAVIYGSLGSGSLTWLFEEVERLRVAQAQTRAMLQRAMRRARQYGVDMDDIEAAAAAVEVVGA